MKLMESIMLRFGYVKIEKRPEMFAAVATSEDSWVPPPPGSQPLPIPREEPVNPAPPRPVNDDEEWEWQLALARARARSEAPPEPVVAEEPVAPVVSATPRPRRLPVKPPRRRFARGTNPRPEPATARRAPLYTPRIHRSPPPLPAPPRAYQAPGSSKG